jgi:hypothetical protein
MNRKVRDVRGHQAPSHPSFSRVGVIRQRYRSPLTRSAHQIADEGFAVGCGVQQSRRASLGVLASC